MASCDDYRPKIRNDEWKEDKDLNEELFNFVRQNMKRKEILDFVAQKYPMHAWSLRSLCRRLRYFNIKFVDYNVELNCLEEAVREKMKRPGNLLGYRSLHKIKDPRNTRA